MTPIELAAKYVDRFAEVSIAVEPQHGSILPSEMLLFCAAALEAGVSTVIESGRRFGQSTEILAMLNNWTVYSVERDSSKEQRASDARLARHANLRLVAGSGERMVPRLAAEHAPAAVLLDGPKGVLALSVANSIKTPVVAIHDCYPHTEVRQRFTGAVFTDDPEYVERFGWLDEATLKYRGHANHGEILPFAGVLGVRL